MMKYYTFFFKLVFGLNYYIFAAHTNKFVPQYSYTNKKMKYT